MNLLAANSSSVFYACKQADTNGGNIFVSSAIFWVRNDQCKIQSSKRECNISYVKALNFFQIPFSVTH